MFYILYRDENDEPVNVLRTFVGHFLRGRSLDISDESVVLEGETTEIFVSRLNVYEDGMDELLSDTNHDYSLPLDVTFTGELALDMGGPRKEFLAAMMRQIQEKLFMQNDGENTFVLHENETAENKSHYLGAYCILSYSFCLIHFVLFILSYSFCLIHFVLFKIAHFNVLAILCFKYI
jgi:hypothetical protein